MVQITEPISSDPAGSLGTYGNSCAVPGQRWSREDLLDLREALWEHSVIEDLRKCGRVPCAHRMPIREHGGGFRLGGLCRCHSVWACPMCAPEIRARRGEEIGLAVELHLEECRGVSFGSATLPHGAGDRLKDSYSVVASAWADVNRDWSVRRFRKGHGFWGFCRSCEITYGSVNGWHPHAHWLDFWEEPLGPEDVVDYHSIVHGAWSRSVDRHGFRLPSLAHGVDVRSVVDRRGAARELGDYMTEISPRRAGHELTAMTTKQAKQSGLGPWDILYNVRMGVLDPWRRLWNEYERGTRGRRLLGPSHGLFGRIGLAVDDPGVVEGGRVVASIDSDTWGQIRFFGRGLSGAQLILERAAVRGQLGVDEAVAVLLGGVPVAAAAGPDSVQLVLGPGDDGGVF